MPNESEHVGNIGYFEVYHIEDEGVLRAFTNRDDFETEVEVPDDFDGTVTSIRNNIYPDLVNAHNEWLLEQ